MRAAVYDKYGSSGELQLREIDKPLPRGGEVLIKVHAASINSFDMRHLKADPLLIHEFKRI